MLVPAARKIVNPTILGAAGEHYVMCQLLRRGMIAALAPAGVPDADIIVSNRLGSSLAAVQVKARRRGGTKGGWVMKAKHETIRRPLLLYAFVDFGKTLDAVPECWILPSETVANAVKESHAAWLAMPGKDHEDSDMRGLSHDYSKYGIGRPLGWLDPYQEAWDLIAATSEKTLLSDNSN
jgi:hypothetical protein